jgi:hypothetical protein
VELRGSAGTVLSKCRIHRNAYQAVWACEGARGSITDCDVRGNARGPWRLEAGTSVTGTRNTDK